MAHAARPELPSAGTTIVTGAGGFAGGHLLKALTREHHSVLGWIRHGAADATTRVVDILAPETIHAALAAITPTGLVHLAGAPHVGQSWQDTAHPLRVNGLGTHHVLDALRQRAPHCKILVVTSAMVYAPTGEAVTENHPLGPTSPYGLSKLAQDELARRAGNDDGLSVVVARPFNHIGPGQSDTFAISSFCKQIAQAECGRGPATLRVGNLDARRDLADVRDVADAYVTLLDHAAPGTVWNICTGQAHRIGDLLDHLRGLSRVPIAVEPDPARMRPADQPLLVGDATRLRDTFGWRPRYTLQQTLGDMLEWWRGRV